MLVRILIIHNEYQDLGGEDFVFKQESAALETLHEVETLVFKNQKGLKGLAQFALSPWNFFAAHKVKQKIKAYNPDIVHFHNTQYACGPLVIRQAKKMNKIVVMSLHNYRLLCPSATLYHKGEVFLNSIKQQFPWKAVLKKVLDNSLLKTFWTAFSYWLHRKAGTWTAVDKYFVLTQFSKNMIASSTLPINPDRIVVKPNFYTQKNGIENTKRQNHFLYIGRLSQEKGILELVQSLTNTNFKLHIAGSGPLSDKIKEYASSNPNITYLGMLDAEHVVQQLQVCKALIVPSVCLEGGVPLTIIEAFSYRTPVIASNIGPIPETIKNGVTGFLFNPHHKQDAAATLRKVHEVNQKEIDLIVENAYQLYRKMYLPEVILKQLNDNYHELTKD